MVGISGGISSQQDEENSRDIVHVADQGGIKSGQVIGLDPLPTRRRSKSMQCSQEKIDTGVRSPRQGDDGNPVKLQVVWKRAGLAKEGR